MTRHRRASVEDLWTKSDGTPSARNGRGMRWRARFVDASGAERTKAFAKKHQAQTWLDGIVSSQVTGTYVDPKLGKATFGSFNGNGRRGRFGKPAPATAWTWPPTR
jgi:hypothetical protein